MLQAQQSQNSFFGMDLNDSTFNLTNFNMSETEPSYCLCGQPYDPDIFMIQCDSCKDWFHSRCCNFREWQAIEIDKYHCPRCTPLIGPSIYKTYQNTHRHDYWDENAAGKPVQTGTPAFILELRSRHFTPADDICVHIGGHELTEEFLNSKGFNKPIIIPNKDGLDMIMPPENFSYIDVLKLVGDDKEIDVIDVCRQSNVRMTLGDFVDYVINSGRTRIFNVVSLEFSNTGMTHIIEPPVLARKLDWATTMWPDNIEGRPQVQKYCLMSVKDSYTDFHIDFGGTSVWYHVLRGEKVFYFVKPTPANLTLYSQWMTSTNQSETFFGDQIDCCYKYTLRQGQTMLIPTGWIHAVYTPVDSLVFGGNFLHHYNISMQLNCYEIERKTKTDKKYLYPNFITINLFAAAKLLEEIIKINMQAGGGVGAPENLLSGLKTLQQAIKHWNNEKDYNMSVREQLPYDINIPKLLKDIGKEIRHAERIINHLNPPKPERESKRKRRKPINKDFVDYSLSPRSFNFDYMPVPASEFNSKPSYSKSQNSGPKLKLTLPKPATFPYERSNMTKLPPVVYNDNPLPSMDNNQMWSLPFSDRSQESVAPECKGGTVLKFKLGGKDIIPPAIVPPENLIMNVNVNMPLDPFDQNFENKDVYDFHDDSDRDDGCLNFTIDENPLPQPKKKKKTIKTRLPDDEMQSNEVRDGSSLYRDVEHVSSLDLEVKDRSNLDIGIEDEFYYSITKTNPEKKRIILVIKSVPNKQKLPSLNISTNGIESLLQASLSVPGSSHGSTSPSTSEAIAGMLSISNWSPASKSRSRYPQFSEEDVTNVHQDEDYIYPSLDNSDDEEMHIFKPRGRSKTDEAWNPKARVGPLLPKMNRPAREGTKKQAVEKVLEAAAAKRTGDGTVKNSLAAAKRQYRRKKLKPKAEPSALAGTMLLPSTGTLTSPIIKPAPPPPPPPATVVSSTSAAAPKPRKGMKTVKQRLGKILKIHKMIH
ncbi:histone lysine demethylase PHF8-like isoform X2 [Anthonomus grandis grandis]|uniref:histone lysine demethylase PHF8-like isoform X2 n=1 Tax=Anthonomus grandis grandis TaxID=2921223 RepID=UPI00216699A0|nr:histone lysine demethylase PHF8-like isoform X2 [Anthonomus grandis grandis]